MGLSPAPALAQSAPTATTGAASGVSGTGATLNGTVNANGYSTTVTFEYGTTIAYGNTVAAVPSPVTGSTDTAVSANVSLLDPNTTYHYRVSATNVSGTTNGADMTFTTLPLAPTVTTGAASGVSGTGATLNGTVNANGDNTTVTFEYGLDTNYGTTVTADQSPVTGSTDTAVSKNISGLTPNTTYHYRIVGTNSGGTTNGADMTFTTSVVPPTATTAAASGVSGTGATLNGTVNANNSSTTVTFEYGTTIAYGNTVAAVPSEVTGTADTAVSANVSGLTQGTTYHYRVVGVNSGGTTNGADMTFLAIASPEMNLKQGINDIADGGSYNFGNQVLNTDTDVTFTIENLGTADLNLTTPIAISGAGAVQFSIQSQPISPVAVSGSTAFTVRFSPTSTGAKTATIEISNNDSDENPYNLTITGTGITPLTVTTDSDVGDDATNGANLTADTADGAGLSLREALYWAAAGDNVTFEPGLSGQTITLSGTQLTIDEDIFLDGDLDDDGSPDITVNGNGTSRVIYTAGLTVAARLEGLIITSGIATQGGGLYNAYSSSPTIINCTFSGNAAIWNNGGGSGGGIYNNLSSPTITNCTFASNTAISGGGIYNDNWSPTITDCTFTGNTATGVSGSGGGMYNNDSYPTITGCTFTGNTASSSGGGMENFICIPPPTITSCNFTGNSANIGGGIYNYWESPSITDCIFTGNTATSGGGGMFNNDSSPSITGCTFSGNSATSYGGGMYNTDSSPTITSCNFTGNTAIGPWVGGGGMFNSVSSPAITNSNFTGNTAASGGGIDNMDSSPTITGSNFFGNSANLSGGGMSNGNSSPTITNCTFSGNTATGIGYGGGGISNFASSPAITNCTFTDNTAYQGAGMHINNSSPTITGSTFSGNSANSSGGALNIANSPATAIINCIIWGNSASSYSSEISGYGGDPAVTYSDVAGGHAGTGNIDTDPLFVDAAGGDFHLQSKKGHWTPGGWVTDAQTSPCIDAGDPASAFSNEPSPNGGRINIGSYGNTAQASKTVFTLTVTTDSDAGDDATVGADLAADTVDGSGLSLREALNWADTGDSVIFEAGLSGQTITLSGTVLSINKDITLDGDLNDDSIPDITVSGNNTGGVIYTNGLTAAASLEGLIITSGNTTMGGGMYNDYSSPTITNCIFSGNTANISGGMYNFYSSPIITNCIFAGNTASGMAEAIGGGMLNINSSPEVTGSIFSGNSANGGGGMANMDSSPVITDCTFSGNTANAGGGMYNLNSSAVIINCTFSNNTVSGIDEIVGGGMFNDNSSPDITNSIFSGNEAVLGGGIFNKESSPNITNCTFFGNSASFDGSGMYNAYYSEPDITNCVLWSDTGDEIFNDADSSANVTYSDVEGGYSGTGNIDSDPLFVNVGGGDFHLQSQGGHWTSGGWVTDAQTSPCIDTGDPSSDYGTEPAPNGERVNMGAYGNTAQASKSLTPEIDLTGITGSHDDGGYFIFGYREINTNTDATFTIENTGPVDLMLATPFTLEGPYTDQFSILQQPTSPVAPSGSTTFTVRFTPTSVGEKGAVIYIDNNDIDENPYEMWVVGAGTPAQSVTGGGIADYYSLNTDIVGTKRLFLITYSGKIMETGNVTSSDEVLTITIPKGTIAKDKYGKGLGTLKVSVNDNPPPPPEDNQIIGLTYSFKPDGATFDPPITLTYCYDPDTLPSGVSEQDLVIAYCDEGTKAWIKLDSICDMEKHTITASVSHSTDFAIIGKVTPLPALFSASNLLVQPNEVKPNEVVTATVTVTNTGSMEGTYNLTLKINGVDEETKDITVAASATESVSFTLSKKQSGIYAVDVNGLEGSFTVIAPPPATILPPSPTLPKPAPVPPPTPPPTSVLPPAPEPVSIYWWLIIGGAIIACAVIGLAAWLMIARRRG